MAVNKKLHWYSFLHALLSGVILLHITTYFILTPISFLISYVVGNTETSFLGEHAITLELFLSLLGLGITIGLNVIISFFIIKHFYNEFDIHTFPLISTGYFIIIKIIELIIHNPGIIQGIEKIINAPFFLGIFVVQGFFIYIVTRFLVKKFPKLNH